jgi:hypothetical protein
VTNSDLPQAEVLDLTVDEVALQILRHCSQSTPSRTYILSPYTWNIGRTGLPWDRVEARASDAWDLLLRLGLIRELVHQNGSLTAEFTERGKAVVGRDPDLRRARAETRIDMGLHPLLEAEVKAHFMRGDYTTAVFEAMREVEIQVRELAEFDATDLGPHLMRKAFDAQTGVLRDHGRPTAENESTSHLFAGAIGLKEPREPPPRRLHRPYRRGRCDPLLADQLLRELDGITTRLDDYRRFIRDEVGDGSEEIPWPPGLMGLGPRDS